MRRIGFLHISLAAILCAACALLARRAPAQEVTAAVSGQVTDQSGAVIANAAITATDVNRGTRFETKSDSAGEYYLPRLPVGTYTLQAEATGFQTIVHSAFTLVLNQTARIDFRMTVGKVSQVVTVTAAGPILQEQTTEISTVINAATNVALPLASRNYLQLTMLAPGVTTTNPVNMQQSQRIDTAEEP